MTSLTCSFGLTMALLLLLGAPPVGAHGQVAAAEWALQDRGPRAPEVIVREFDAIQMPSYYDGNSPEALAAFDAAIRSGCTLQAKLGLELWTVKPDHPEVPRLMDVRWMVMCNVLGQTTVVDSEVEPFLLADTPRALRRNAHWARAHARLALDVFEGRPQRKAIQAAIDLDPKNERGAWYLSEYVIHHATDMSAAKALCQRIIAHYGETCDGAWAARRCLSAFEALGKPRVLQLTDFRNSKRLTSRTYANRPFLVHTWSGDLSWNAATLEGTRQLASQYGIDCIGVSTFAPRSGEAALEAQLESLKVHWPIAIDVADAARPWITNWEAPLADGYFLFDGEGVLIAVGSDLRVVQANVERVMNARMPQR